MRTGSHLRAQFTGDAAKEYAWFGPGASLGHYGWGGSMAMADPSRRLSAAYVMTRQSPHLIGDPRAVRLLEALYGAR